MNCRKIYSSVWTTPFEIVRYKKKWKVIQNSNIDCYIEIEIEKEKVCYAKNIGFKNVSIMNNFYIFPQERPVEK